MKRTIGMHCKKHVLMAGIGAMLMLGGCATSPQSVQVNPVVSVSESTKNTLDSNVSVTVFDERTTAVIGLRGGVYDTNEITAKGDLPLALRAAIEKGLREMGATISASSDDPQFHVYLDTLEYTVPKGSYVTQVDVKTSMRVVVSHNNRQFTGNYGSELTERVAKAPSDKKNEELINQVLGDVLERVFADKGLQGFVKAL